LGLYLFLFFKKKKKTMNLIYIAFLIKKLFMSRWVLSNF